MERAKRQAKGEALMHAESVTGVAKTLAVGLLETKVEFFFGMNKFDLAFNITI